MPDTFVKIASVTVGAGGVPYVTFSSIPQTYTDLVIKGSVRNSVSTGSSGYYIQFNGSSSGYSDIALRNQNGTPNSYSQSAPGAIQDIKSPDASLTANTFSNDDIYIPNYRSSNYKSISIDNAKELNAATSDGMNQMLAWIWANTSAITSIEIGGTSSGNLVQYSTLTLYGIKNS